MTRAGYQRPGSPAARAISLLQQADWLQSTAIAKALGMRPRDLNAHLACAVLGKRLWKEVRSTGAGGKKSVFYKLRTPAAVDRLADELEAIESTRAAAAALQGPTPVAAEAHTEAVARAGRSYYDRFLEARDLPPDLPPDRPPPSAAPTAHCGAIRMLIDDAGELLLASEDGCIRLPMADVRRLSTFLDRVFDVFDVVDAPLGGER